MGLLLVLILAVTPPFAEAPRTPPEATQHALDELANCRAQQRPECPTSTPTPSPTSTLTLTPTPTATPTSSPTSTETPGLTPTPEPCWQVDGDSGDIVFDEDGAPVPCPDPTDEPTPEPTATPTDVPSTTPTPAPVRAVAAPPLALASAPQVRVVVQTVVVTVETTRPPVATFAPTATVTPTPTLTPTVLALHAATPTVVALLVPTATSVPTARGPVAASTGHWDWGTFLAATGLVMVLVALSVWLLTRRRVVVWRTPKGTSHAS